MKGRIVRESLEPGATVKEVALRHRIAPQQLTTWRRAARQGRLALPKDPVVSDGFGFAALVAAEEPALRMDEGLAPAVVIVAGGAVVRLDGATARRLIAWRPASGAARFARGRRPTGACIAPARGGDAGAVEDVIDLWQFRSTPPRGARWPRPGRKPYVFDIATAVAARGEIELHRRAGKPLPEGWAIEVDIDFGGRRYYFGSHQSRWNPPTSCLRIGCSPPENRANFQLLRRSRL